MTKSTSSNGGLDQLWQTMTSHIAAQEETNAQVRNSLANLDQKFTELFNLLKKDHPIRGEGSENTNPNLTHRENQVPISNSEPGLSPRIGENRLRNALVESREGVMKRVELPTFGGEDVYGWIAVAERFFRVGGYCEAEKLDLVSVSLCGDVLSWFYSAILRRPFANWKEFKDKLIARFSRVKLRDPSQPFFAVHQTGSVAEYIHKFEDLSTQVSGLSEKQLEGIFMNGLTPEMQEVVNICKPVDLPEMISTAYQMESSSLHSLVLKERKLTKVSQTSVGGTSKSYSSYNSNNAWKQIQPTPGPSQPQQRQISNPRPQVKLTENQIVEKKRLGLCFKCDGKWSRQHVCPNYALQVFTVIYGVEMEITDQESLSS